MRTLRNSKQRIWVPRALYLLISSLQNNKRVSFCATFTPYLTFIMISFCKDNIIKILRGGKVYLYTATLPRLKQGVQIPLFTPIEVKFYEQVNIGLLYTFILLVFKSNFLKIYVYNIFALNSVITLIFLYKVNTKIILLFSN